MRKFTLMFAFLIFSGILFAQSDCNYAPLAVDQSEAVITNPKAFGDIIWSEDFDGAKWASTVVEDGNGYLLNTDESMEVSPLEGWTVIDNNDLSYFWHWSDVGPRGSYVTPASVGAWDDTYDGLLTTLASYGASTSNGVMMLESNYFNNTPTGGLSSNYLDMDAIIQYGPIDMSAAPGAIFNLKTMYRTCCAAARLLGLSIGVPDGSGGITWSDEIAIHTQTPNNAHTYASERDVHINISRVKAGTDFIVTAGAPAVYFRLHKSAAAFYYWFIDDIKIYEPPVSDIIVEDQWFDYMYNALDENMGQSSNPAYNFWGGYTQIPQSVVAPFVQFRAAVNNNGTTDATNATLNVEITGAKTYSVGSTPKTVAKFMRDTLMVSTDFTPSEFGHYQVSLTVDLAEADENIANNGIGLYDFYVVDNVYSRVTPDGEADFSTAGPSDWASGAYDGDVVAQPYDFPASVAQVALKGIQVYFALPSTDADETAINNGEFAMYARVYKIDEAGDIVDASIASDLYTIAIEDTNSWISLDFLDEGNLVVPGGQQYYVGIETYTGFVPTDDERRRFEIGADITGAKQPLNGGLVYLSSLGGWYSTGDNYAINLVLNAITEPEMVNVTFNVDMTQPIDAEIFTVGTDVLYTTGNFTGWAAPGDEASIILTDADGDKIYTAVVEMEANYGEIQYKYFNNAGWDGGEWTGDPNRIATVADVDLTLNDTWVVISVSDNNLEAITIAPNPFNGELLINNAAGVSQIIVSNVLGQAVMTVNQVTNHVTLSTEGLNNGVYFVTFIDNQNNMRTERVVKK